MANYDKNYETSGNSINNAGQILIGFIIGAAAGAIAGILLAPDKGENTRQSIFDASSKLKSDINDQVQRGVDKINTLKGQALSKVGIEDNQKNGKKSPVGEEGNSGNF